MINFKNPENQLARWIELLGTYDFVVEHRSAKSHTNADALPRKHCLDCRYCECLEGENKMEEREPSAMSSGESTVLTQDSSMQLGAYILQPETRTSGCQSKHEETMMQKASGFGGKSLSDGDLCLEKLSDPDLALIDKLKEFTKGRPT